MLLVWLALGATLGDAGATPFKLVWDLSSATSITLPLNTSLAYSLLIDWGDGTAATTHTTLPITNNYAAAGMYTMTITGSLPGWTFGYADCFGSASYVYAILQWGSGFTVDAGSGYMFYGCSNMVSVNATDQPTFMPNADLSYAFADCTGLTTGNTFNWNTSQVVTMANMFQYDYYFDSAINFTDTSYVTDMSSMFYEANVFNHPLNFNTKNVMTFNSMFYYANAFNQPLNWNTAAATDMSYMFDDATAFNAAVTFDTKNVQTMEEMFYYATAFNGVITFTDTSNVMIMTSMFQDAYAFNQPLNFNTRSVTIMDSMFREATAFNQNLAWNVTGVQSMYEMFEGASSFNQPLATWKLSSVTDVSYMFDYCSTSMSFTQDLSAWTVPLVTSCTRFFASIAMSPRSRHPILVILAVLGLLILRQSRQLRVGTSVHAPLAKTPLRRQLVAMVPQTPQRVAQVRLLPPADRLPLPRVAALLQLALVLRASLLLVLRASPPQQALPPSQRLPRRPLPPP